MLDALFSSSARIRLLQILLLEPNGRFYLRELAARSGLQLRSVQRELANLTGAGILLREVSGRQTYYRTNDRCPIVPELRSIFVKTAGLADVLRQALADVSNRISAAFVFGSFAKGLQKAESDIDLVVIGSVGFGEVVQALRPAQDRLGREVNPTVFSPQEIRARLATGEHFISSVMGEDKVFVIGDEHDLRELGCIRLAGETSDQQTRDSRSSGDCRP